MKNSKIKAEVTQSLILESISLEQKIIKLSTELFLLQVYPCSTVFLRSHAHGDAHGLALLQHLRSALLVLLYNAFFFLHCVVDYGAFLDLA
jgi:hypothetical protein